MDKLNAGMFYEKAVNKNIPDKQNCEVLMEVLKIETGTSHPSHFLTYYLNTVSLSSPAWLLTLPSVCFSFSDSEIASDCRLSCATSLGICLVFFSHRFSLFLTYVNCFMRQLLEVILDL